MVLVGACAVLAACGGGGSSGSTGSLASSGSSAPPGSSTDPPATTVPEPVETTVPASTSSPTTSTTSTTTSTTTTLAPTTTLSEEQASIAAAEEALVAAFEAKSEALANPSDDSLRARVSSLWTEPSLSSVLTQLDQFVSDGLILRISTDPVAFVDIVGQSTQVAPDRVAVTYCRLDSNVITMAEPLGDLEVVVDDSVTTRIWRGVMLLADGSWRFSGAEVVAESDGAVACEQLL
jgi:hypothetical protein